MMAETAMERMFVIVNPASGNAIPDALRKSLATTLYEGDGRYEVHETVAGEDLAETARTAVRRGFATVVAAGGDGTVSQVANGLARTQARLGIIPLGTANVLARELGIPLESSAACQLLAGPNGTALIDGIQIDESCYFTQVGTGLDALMIRDTTSVRKRQFGNLAYLWTATKRWVGFEAVRFSIVVDGEPIRIRAAQVLLANCGALGTSGMRWGPDMRVDDGRINVCVIRPRTRLDYFRAFWSALRYRHRDDPSLIYRIAERTVAIHADRALPVQADGEAIGDTPITAQVAPAILRIVVPAEGLS